MFKAVIFDLGGVCFTSRARYILQKISQDYNIPQERVNTVFWGELRTLHNTGEIDGYEFWSEFSKQLGINEKPEELLELELEGFAPIEETFSLIRELRAKGLMVFYLSDTSIGDMKYLDDKYHHLGEFDGGVFSFEVKALKPDLKMYNTVLEKIGCQPHEAVFIDDKVHLLEAAEKIGLKTIQFKNPFQLMAKLKELDVL